MFVLGVEPPRSVYLSIEYCFQFICFVQDWVLLDIRSISLISPGISVNSGGPLLWIHALVAVSKSSRWDVGMLKYYYQDQWTPFHLALLFTNFLRLV